MSIFPGQTLANYRLIEKIGEGGMGVVWKASDTTLEREVAIKVLPEALAHDHERLARFEREAKLLASLSHPNIAAVHGLHESEGIRFLAMELVAGNDLTVRLERGLSLDESVHIALQVAEALEAAHENGVIHRDLKPANIRITADGKAKVLDFGLAKAFESSPSGSSDPSVSPTLTSAGTVAGMILGTAAYMSPEQAAGQPIDKRSDTWSFGVVLYELLVGKRLFEGETVSHTLADVLRATIDWSALPDGVPVPLGRLLRRCLERDPRRRLRDIGEARIALADVIADPHQTGASAAETPTAAKPASPLPWIVAGVAAVVAAIGFFWNPSVPGSTEPTRRFTLEIPNSGSTRQGDGQALAISSDGRFVVTRGGGGAEQLLYRRAINDFETQVIEGTVGGRNPFLSPDDKWIGFLWATDLHKVRASGGASIKVGTGMAAPDGVHWGTDGYIYYGDRGRIWRVSEGGGQAEGLTELENEGESRLGLPFLIPETKTLLCNRLSAPGVSGQLYALDLESRELKDLEMSGSDARYLPTGHVLFAQGERISVAPFDAKRLEFTGPPADVHPRAWIDQGQMQLDVSAEGTVVYMPVTREDLQLLVTVDLDGQVEPLIEGELPFISLNDPRISRDGRRLLISVEGGAIWMLDLGTQTPTLMSESGFYPHWSPDGSEIIYSSTRGTSYDIYLRPVDLSRPEEMLLDVENNLRAGDWTHQGTLIIREEIPDKGMDLRYLDGPGDASQMVPLLEGEDDELAPIVSYDGKWLAYVSNYSGSDEVYITTFPEPGARLQISTKGGTSPTWAPDGSALYYFEGRALVAVSIVTEPRFTVTGRKTLFEGSYVQYRWSRQYDIMPDGKRFVLVQNPARGNVEVVTNWFAEISDEN